MNLYAILAGVVAALLAIGGSGYQGYRMGKDSVIARQARDDAVRFETLQLAQLGAAEAIAAQKVTNTTIRQKTETITREVPVYRDCINDAAVMRLLDDARAGRAPSEPAGGGIVP